jgi:hypothetical protein
VRIRPRGTTKWCGAAWRVRVGAEGAGKRARVAGRRDRGCRAPAHGVGRAFAVRWIKGARQTVFFCCVPRMRRATKKSLLCTF